MVYFIHHSGATIFCIALIYLSYIDIVSLTLPDKITLPLLWLGLLINIVTPFASLDHAVLGAIAGYLLFFIISWAIVRVRKIEGLGRGDAKLLALLGAWLGVEMLPVIIFIASLTGTIFGLLYLSQKNLTYSTQIPFGPFLALAGILGLLWKPEILQYQHIITHL